MASKNRNAVRAGIFMILSVILTIVIVVAIAGVARLTQTWQERTVEFNLTDDVGGLNVGDDVRIGGFKVGVVKAIDIYGYEHPEAAHPPRIIVRFSLPRRYAIREGTKIGIQGTLTGQSWLNIDVLGSGPPMTADSPLEGKPSITSVLATHLSEIAPEFKGLLADVRNNTVPRLNTTIDDAHSLLTEVRPRVNTAADHASETLVAIRDLVGPSTGDFHSAVADIHQITANLKDKMPGLIDSTTGLLHKVDDAVTRASGALDDVRETAANAKDATASARSILIENRGKFDGIIASLKTTSENLKNASAEIRRSPWRLLYKPGTDEVANLNLFDSAREFADGANALSDASTALRDAMADKNAKAEDIKQLMEKVNESFKHFQDVEQKLWKDVQQ